MGLTIGAYLKAPVTDKISSDESNDKLKCGISCMQGWRVSQEDAHNCVLDFDVNTSLFAVYDGHGGHEVAAYCSQKLPDYIKNTEAYKEKDFEKALVDAFLGFDATITKDEVIAELREIAKQQKLTMEVSDSDSSDSEVEDSVKNLCEEATMPLDQVMEKYVSSVKKLITQKMAEEESPLQAAGSSSKAALSSGESSSSASACTQSAGCANSSASNADSSSRTSKELENGSIQKSEAEVELDSKCDKSKSNTDSKCDKISTKAGDDLPSPNGDVQNLEKEKSKKVDAPVENGEISKKGKGKATMKTKGSPISPTIKTRPKRNAQQLYSKLLEFESESDSEDEEEEDKTFEGPNDSSSDDEHPKVVAYNDDNSESSSEEDQEEEEEADEDEDDDDECAKDYCENPGSESGCTAVVALLHESQLFVANAGDSRCVVCRDGKAVEMSFDHKPSDKPEYDRIVKAGGFVNSDGRVDDGLNLSRAIGDHSYKQNKELSDREQKVTALPDIRTLTINPKEDEFMVLACDGIWNSMTSQEVVDFVKPKIQAAEKLSQICEQMFDHCLASDTDWDGSGCDNMTAIIVQFTTNIHKRSNDELECVSTKRSKKEETVSQSGSTASE